MSNFVQQQATYPLMKNTGFRSLNDNIADNLKYKARVLSRDPGMEPPPQPPFRPTQPDFVPKFNGGWSSNLYNRDTLHRINVNTLVEDAKLYN